MYDVREDFRIPVGQVTGINLWSITKHCCDRMGCSKDYEHNSYTWAAARDYVARQYWDLYQATGFKVYLVKHSYWISAPEPLHEERVPGVA
jgi:hypothetical protein